MSQSLPNHSQPTTTTPRCLLAPAPIYCALFSSYIFLPKGRNPLDLSSNASQHFIYLNLHSHFLAAIPLTKPAVFSPCSCPSPAPTAELPRLLGDLLRQLPLLPPVKARRVTVEADSPSDSLSVLRPKSNMGHLDQSDYCRDSGKSCFASGYRYTVAHRNSR